MTSKGSSNGAGGYGPDDVTTMFRPARTILRIKRRRDEEPIPRIRLEGLVDSSSRTPKRDDDGGDGTRRRNTSRFPNGTNKTNDGGAHCSAVMWRRFEPGNEGGPDDHGSVVSAASSSGRFRIVNAMLVDGPDDDDDGGAGGGERQKDDDPDNHGTSRKRRRLTVLDTSTTTAGSINNSNYNKADPSNNNPFHSVMASPRGAAKRSPRQPLKILDPLTRVVDDSLQQVLVGTRGVAEHYDMLDTDPRFTLQEVGLQRRWWTWNHSSGGNIVHCCALWNDSSVLHNVLQNQHRSLSHQYRTRHSTAASASASANPGGAGGGSILGMMEAPDGDGRTPYEVAQLAGHGDVCQVLEAYGGDTTNYVYDIFYLDDDSDPNKSEPGGGGPSSSSATGGASGGDDADGNGAGAGPSSPIMTAELTSGVGYWTPEGELILEADEKCSRSLSYETDGEIDSNCEEYGGNDYPDEEEEEDDGDDDEMGGLGGQIGNAVVPDDDVNDRDEDCRLIQVHDNYDEYDWEQDLGEGGEHSYYDESYFSEED